MQSPWLRNVGPNMQVLAFTVVFFICTILTATLLQVLLRVFFEIDFSDPEALSNMEDPSAVSAHRLMSIFNSIGVFLLPSLITYRLISFPVEDFLKMKKNPILILSICVIALGFAVQAPTNFIYDLNQQISFPESLAGMESNIIAMEEERAVIIEGLFARGNVEAFVINLFVLALLPALAEEFFFRGVLQQLFQKAFNNKHHIAIWMTAFVFSFIHFQFLGFFPRVMLGALLGYVFYYSGNIWYAVLLHFVNNALGIIIHFMIINKQLDKSYESIGANEKILLIISCTITAGLIWFFRKRSLQELKS